MEVEYLTVAIPDVVPARVTVSLYTFVFRWRSTPEASLIRTPLDGAVGVMAFDGSDAGPVPAALTARTVKVYSTPGSRATVIGLEVPDAVKPPGDDVAT